MVREGRTIRRMLCIALLAAAFLPNARAGDDPGGQKIATRAPVELPHAIDLLFTEQARRRAQRPDNIESVDPVLQKLGLVPVVWPRNTDMRARILTPELKRTPVVGWLAENLYRSKSDNGWSLEVDPGEGQYVVFYRFHPKR